LKSARPQQRSDKDAGRERRVEIAEKDEAVTGSRVSERRFIAPKVMPKRCVVLEEN
jgi:hypothetical protein